MVTTFYLIRHGETEGDGVKRYKGHIDVPLSENGIRQMKRLSVFISAEVQKCRNTSRFNQDELPSFQTSAIASIYCSDLSRAIKSAEIIAEPFGLKPIVMPDLRERSFGLWEGMSFDEIREKYPEEFKAWVENPLRFSPIGGESTMEVKDRVIAALDRILKDSSERVNKSLEFLNPGTLESICIVIVSHGGVNRIILCHVLGIPLENIFRIEQDYGALNIVEFYDGYPVIKLINYTC